MSTRMDILWALNGEPLTPEGLAKKVKILTGQVNSEKLFHEAKLLTDEGLVFFQEGRYHLSEKGQVAKGQSRED